MNLLRDPGGRFVGLAVLVQPMEAKGGHDDHERPAVAQLAHQAGPFQPQGALVLQRQDAVEDSFGDYLGGVLRPGRESSRRRGSVR